MTEEEIIEIGCRINEERNKIAKAFNELKQNRVVTVVGCGGDRDRTKRPIMGDIACKLSDHVIFTNDNPRTEDPNQIMNDIVKDLKYNNYEIHLLINVKLIITNNN